MKSTTKSARKKSPPRRNHTVTAKGPSSGSGPSPSDVIILGAGPAGLALAINLAQSGIKTTLIESQSEQSLANPDFDGRDIALTKGSMAILNDLGVLPYIPKNALHPARGARVYDASSATYSLDFMRTDTDVNADEEIGFFVSNHIIRKAVYDRAKTWPNITIISNHDVINTTSSPYQATATILKKQQNGAGGSTAPNKAANHPITMSAPLIVAADGRFSPTRRRMGIATHMKDFGRTVVVARVKHQKPHDHCATECFGYDQTLAILPLSAHMSSVVVTLPSQHAPELMAMDDHHFAQHIEKRFHHRLGAMTCASARFAYPLVATYAQSFAAERCALLGDAAVGMHPVTAHGYNFGLKGQDFLAKAIVDAKANGIDIGAASVLTQYDRQHRAATLPLFHGTNFLVGLYTDTRPIAKWARQAILHIGNRLTPVKRMITRYLADAQ